MVKILVVDDEPEVTDAIVKYLESNYFEVHGAKNSKEAFEALEKYKPNILLLDIDLKEKYSGVDILKKALELNPKTQVAMVTILTDEEIKEDPLRAGAKLVLKKPLKIERLKRIVYQLAKNL